MAMIPIDDVVRRHAVARVELEAWIAERWVQPASGDGGFSFDDADVARVGLICELRRDLLVPDETIPLVLDLLDQLYAARRALADVGAVLDRLPDPVREEIRRHLRRAADGGEE